MKRLLPLLTVLLIYGCGSVSNPEAAVNSLQPRAGISDAQLETVFHRLSYFPNGTQFSLALINDGDPVFYGALRENDTLKTIVNGGRAFEIGSISKVFTSTLLAEMAAAGTLALSDPVQQYLDFPLSDSLPITFAQLSSHSSGLPRLPSGFLWESLWNMDNPYKNYGETKLRAYLQQEIEVENEPGSSFRYSNIGAGILGYVLTRIEHKSYEALLREKIFLPYEMHNSTTERKRVEEILVGGLDKGGDPTSNWDLAALPGAGAILSTAEDMSKFMAANFDPGNKALRLQREQIYKVNDKTDMALGWFIIRKDSTTSWYWHNGGTGGYRSSLVLDIDRRRGALVLSNISAGHSHAAGIDSLSFSLMQDFPVPEVTSTN